MAHTCEECGQLCHCDIDDIEFDEQPLGCVHLLNPSRHCELPDDEDWGEWPVFECQSCKRTDIAEGELTPDGGHAIWGAEPVKCGPVRALEPSPVREPSA